MKKQENVLSLFNGLGCVWLALEEAGIKVNKRYSSEIEKFPNKANDTLYPNTEQLGDVRNVDVSKLEHIDFLAGGSPCQSFNLAQCLIVAQMFNNPLMPCFCKTLVMGICFSGTQNLVK